MSDEEKKDSSSAEATEDKQEETKEEAPTEEAKEEAPAAETKTEEAPAEEKANEANEASEADEANVEVPEKFKNLVLEIENMSVLDLNELVKLLEKKFGVSAQAVAVASGGGDGESEEEGGGLMTVELTSAGDQKIAVIKAVKEILGLGLKEAKEMVEGAPAEIKKDVVKEEADEVKGKLEEAGATVTLK